MHSFVDVIERELVWGLVLLDIGGCSEFGLVLGRMIKEYGMICVCLRLLPPLDLPSPPGLPGLVGVVTVIAHTTLIRGIPASRHIDSPPLAIRLPKPFWAKGVHDILKLKCALYLKYLSKCTVVVELSNGSRYVVFESGAIRDASSVQTHFSMVDPFLRPLQGMY